MSNEKKQISMYDRWKKDEEPFEVEKPRKKSFTTNKKLVTNFNPYHDHLGRFASKNMAPDIGLPNGGGSRKTNDFELKNAVEAWTAGSYDIIRDASINPEKYPRIKGVEGSNVLDWVDILESHIANSPKYNGEVYRGIRFKKGQEAELNDFSKKIKNGNIIDMRGISSWTYDKNIAYEHVGGKNGSFIFKLQKGHSGVSIEKYSLNPDEHEVIFSKKSKFKIKNIKTEIIHFDLGDSEITFVDLEETK